jgi:hypothetical protein
MGVGDFRVRCGTTPERIRAHPVTARPPSRLRW